MIVSACCTLADSQTLPGQWMTGSYYQEVTDDTTDEGKAAVVKEFIELEMDRAANAAGNFTTDVLVSTIHPGAVLWCQNLDYADLEVDSAREEAQYPIEQTFTVCGWFLEDGETYSGLWTARGPLLAYASVWRHYRTYDRTFMLSGVHEGIVSRVSWTPTYVDPSCITPEEMISRLAELQPPKLIEWVHSTRWGMSHVIRPGTDEFFLGALYRHTFCGKRINTKHIAVDDNGENRCKKCQNQASQ
jgi:hypothetical protein